jgi:hypothetical protein
MRVTAEAGATTYAEGTLWVSRADAGDVPALQHRALTLPTGTSILGTPGSSVNYGDSLYAVGIASDNIMVDTHLRAGLLGIPRPTWVPTIATGAGTGVTADTVQMFVSAYDELTGLESGLSGASNTLSAVANKNFTTTGIPSTAPDARVTHWRIWRSVNGGSPRLVTTRRVGTTSLTEGVGTLVLGAAFGTSYARMPRGAVAETFHERLCIAGSAIHPDILYLSGVGYPDRYEGLSFRTKKGEPIVGLMAVDTALLVLCPRTAYVLRGYTESDMVMDPVPGGFGVLNGQVPKLIDGNVWGADAKGPWLFDGNSFHRMAAERATEWARLYRQFRGDYDAAIGVENQDEQTYSLWISSVVGDTFATSHNIPCWEGVHPASVAWVAQYGGAAVQPTGGYSQPDWLFDAMARRVTAACQVALPGATRVDVLYGFSDGVVRVVDADDPYDDADDYLKAWTWRTGHTSFGDDGGDKQEGQTLASFWTHMRSPDHPWSVYVRGGYEEVCTEDVQKVPFYPDNDTVWFRDEVAAGNLDPEEVASDATWVYGERTIRVHPVARCSGAGFTFEWRGVGSTTTSLRGFGGSREWGGSGDVRGAVLSANDDDGCGGLMSGGGGGGDVDSGGEGGLAYDMVYLPQMLVAADIYTRGIHYLDPQVQAADTGISAKALTSNRGYPVPFYVPGDGFVYFTNTSGYTRRRLYKFAEVDALLTAGPATVTPTLVGDDSLGPGSTGQHVPLSLVRTTDTTLWASFGGFLGTNVNSVFSYSGSTWAEDSTFPGKTEKSGVILVARGNDLYACTVGSRDTNFGTGSGLLGGAECTGKIWHRSSGGVWTELTNPASGVGTPFMAHCGVVMGGNVYFGGETWRDAANLTNESIGRVIKVDSSHVVTLVHEVNPDLIVNAGTSETVHAMYPGSNSIVYAYGGGFGAADVNKLHCGVFNGTTWDDDGGGLVYDSSFYTVGSAAIWVQSGRLYVAVGWAAELEAVPNDAPVLFSTPLPVTPLSAWTRSTADWVATTGGLLAHGFSPVMGND